MAIDKTKLTGVEKVYPLNVSPYEQYMGDFQNPSVVSKINAMIQSLHQIGRLTNETVSQWNNVMKWIVEGGMDEIAETVTNEKVSVALEEVMRMLDVSLDNGLKELAEKVSGDKIDELLESGQFESMIQTSLTEINEVVDNKLDGFNIQLEKTATKEEVFLKENGININDMDEATRKTFLEAQGIDVNYVLGQGNVKPENTSFMNVTRTNLLDISKMSFGTVASNGTLENTTTQHKTSDFIEVEEGETYISTGTFFSGYYNANKGFVQILSGYSKPFTVPVGLGIKYVRMAYGQTQLIDPMFVKGDSLPKSFIPYSNYQINIPENEFKKSLLRVIEDKFSKSPVTLNQTDFFKEELINLVNPEEVIDGYVNQTHGGIMAATASKVSGFIEVEEGAEYRTNGTWDSGMYNADNVFVSGLKDFQGVIVIPSGVKRIRVTFQASVFDSGGMLNKGTSLLPYVDYNSHENKKMMFKEQSIKNSFIKEIETELFDNNDTLFGLKWNVLGDSITAPTNAYHNVIKQKHNMTVNNYGVSGTRIAVVDGQTNPMVERFATMPDDVDIITVFGGTNDYGSNVPIGTLNSTDKTTFMGALNVLCIGLIEKYPGKRVGFITPMPRSGMDVARMQSYATAMKEVCGKYSIPVLDLLNGSGLYPNNETIKTLYIPDGLHPNSEGHKVIARRIEWFIKSL